MKEGYYFINKDSLLLEVSHLGKEIKMYEKIIQSF
jgi:hypothetical protein